MPTWRRLWARVTARLGDSDLMLVQRLAGTVFLIRVASALLAYGSQVLFARWMGGFEFGIYVYVWTWVLLIGQALDLGLATAAQRFIPEYREHKRLDHLRGYLFGSRLVAVGVAMLVAAFCAASQPPSPLTPSFGSTSMPPGAGICARCLSLGNPPKRRRKK
jgi:O-antigen/teichoic acid export membrane protein